MFSHIQDQVHGSFNFIIDFSIDILDIVFAGIPYRTIFHEIFAIILSNSKKVLLVKASPL